MEPQVAPALSPYALFLQSNAAKAQAALVKCEAPSPGFSPAPLPAKRNAMLLTYEEEEAEYRALHGTSWGQRPVSVGFAEPIEVPLHRDSPYE